MFDDQDEGGYTEESLDNLQRILGMIFYLNRNLRLRNVHPLK